MPEYPDDPAILDDCRLWRWVRPDAIVADPKQPSGFKLSSQAFVDSSDGTPCSIALRDETWPQEEVLQRLPGFAIAEITAGAARGHGQAVLRWPDEELPGHGYVAGRKPHSVKKALARAARWIAGGRNWDSPTPI